MSGINLLSCSDVAKIEMFAPEYLVICFTRTQHCLIINSIKTQHEIYKLLKTSDYDEMSELYELKMLH